MSEPVSAVELRRAMVSVLETLAPPGSERSIGLETFCDELVGLVADMLAVSPPVTAAEVERLTKLFHIKLVEAITVRVMAPPREEFN